jgi:hypothetical protein
MDDNGDEAQGRATGSTPVSLGSGLVPGNHFSLSGYSSLCWPSRSAIGNEMKFVKSDTSS